MYYEQEERSLYQDPMEYDYQKQPVPARRLPWKGGLGRRAAILAAIALLLGAAAGGVIWGVGWLLADGNAAGAAAVSIAEDVGHAIPISQVIGLIETLMA